MPGCAAFCGVGTLVSSACLAARFAVTQVAGTWSPAALNSVQASPVSDQRSSAGSVSVTVTVLPLVSDRVSDPPEVSEKVPFDHGEPASVDEDEKSNERAGGAVPVTVLTTVRVRT